LAVSLGGSNLYSNEEMKKVQFANGALTAELVSLD
jgi:zinc protease